MAQSLVKLTLESNQYERNLRNAQKQLNDFTRSIGINMKSLSGMALAAGAVTGALKVAKDAFFANEQQLDEWGRTVEASKSLYNGFLNALNNGDISGYLSNINTIAEAARAAYDALDELSTFNAFNQVNVEKTRTGMTEAIAGYRMGESSKEGVKTAAEAYKKELQQRQELEQYAYLRAIRKIAAERGVAGSELEKALSGSYGSYKELKNVMPTGKRTVYQAAGQFGATMSYEVPMAVTAEEKMGEALRALNDTELQSLQALGAQAQRTANEIAQTDKMVARMLGGNGGGGGATGGVGGGKVKATNNYVAGSIAAQRQLVAQLTKQWEEAGAEVRDGYKTQLDAAKQTLEEMVNPSGPIMKLWQGDLDDIAGGPGNTTAFAGIDLSQKITGLDPENMPKLLSPLQQLNMEIQRTQELMELSPTSDFYQQMKQHLDELIQKQREFTGETDNDAKKVNTSWQGAASAISSVGGALSNIEDPGGKIAALVAQGIASIVSAFGGALGSDTTTKGNIWTFLAAAAASTVQMISMISQIHDATGYAGGGMIEGNSFSGDNQWARVNSGEVILNRAQQGNLASQLQGNASQFELVGAVRAEQIDLVVRNRARRTGRGEYVTTKFQ